MLIILSAQWPEARIEAAYGRVPIPFLPLGATTCLAAQRRMAPDDRCVLTLPEAFLPDARNRLSLHAGGVTLLSQPGGLSRGQMLADALRQITPDGPVSVTYGDALFPPPPTLDRDWIAVAESGDCGIGLVFDPHAALGTRFAESAGKEDPRRYSVSAGFRATDPALLARSASAGNLRDTLNAYDECRPFEAWLTDDCLSIGTFETYLRAKSRTLYSRAFNAVTRTGDRIVKHSRTERKIEAEARWYEMLPHQLRGTVPTYFGRADSSLRAGYALAFLGLPTLSELSVFGAMSGRTWQTIIAASCDLLERYQSIHPPSGDFAASPDFASAFHRTMHVEKTRTRVATYLRSAGTAEGAAITLNGRLHPPLGQVIEQLIGAIRPTRPEDVRFWHGDFHYGNLFFDARSERVLCIDPRGQLEGGDFTSFGDLRYDVAKLAHSVLGRYDRILMGAARLTIEGPSVWHFATRQLPEDSAVEAQFLARCRSAFRLEHAEVLVLAALLFFSMLPLHGERPDLQRMFLASGLLLADRAGIGS